MSQNSTVKYYLTDSQNFKNDGKKKKTKEFLNSVRVEAPSLTERDGITVK